MTALALGWLLLCGLWGAAQTIDDFEAVVDFRTTLKDLALLLEEGRADTADFQRFYILNVTINDLSPKQSRFYQLQPFDLPDEAAFVRAIKEETDAFTLFLRRALSPQTRQLLESWSGEQVPDQLLAGVLGDLNGVINEGTLLLGGIYDSLDMSPEMAEMAALRPEEPEDRGYISRLLMEEAYPTLIQPLTVLVEVVSGEWIGTEEVRSYHALLLFSGTESFKVFYRRRDSDLGIETNERVSVVATLIQPERLPTGQLAWVMLGHKIRKAN